MITIFVGPIDIDEIKSYLMVVGNHNKDPMAHPMIGTERMKIVGFHLGPEDLRKLEAICSARQLSRSAAIRFIIDQMFMVETMPDSFIGLRVLAATTATAAAKAAETAATTSQAAEQAVQRYLDQK